MAARRIRDKVSDDQAWVQRIKAAKLEERLAKHAQGKLEMSATQIKAAEILLRKIRPDLKAVDHSGEISHQFPTEIPIKLVNKRKAPKQ